MIFFKNKHFGGVNDDGMMKSNEGYFAEWVDFAYWWSFGGDGSASAACAAGLFCYVLKVNLLPFVDLNIFSSILCWYFF